jgi:hypothetical protein
MLCTLPAPTPAERADCESSLGVCQTSISLSRSRLDIDLVADVADSGISSRMRMPDSGDELTSMGCAADMINNEKFVMESK